MRIKWAVIMDTDTGQHTRFVKAKTRDTAMAAAEMRYSGTAFDAVPCC